MLSERAWAPRPHRYAKRCGREFDKPVVGIEPTTAHYEYAAIANPVAKVKKVKAIPPIRILTPEQFAKVLESASDETLPYWLIGGFAGLRRAEIIQIRQSRRKGLPGSSFGQPPED